MEEKDSDSCELEQLVHDTEGSEELLTTSKDGERTPPTTPTKPPSDSDSEGEVHCSHTLQQAMWECKANVKLQKASAVSKESNDASQPTTSHGSMSANAPNSSSHTGTVPKVVIINEKEKTKSTRPDIPPRTSKQPKVSIPYKHHSFLSEVPDVKHMEQSLLQLLEDFHSGNLSAFGKDCSMEQMTDIREQQEKLAKLHFEMGQQQEQGDLTQSGANMTNLLQRLEKLSVCIEKLHSK